MPDNIQKQTICKSTEGTMEICGVQIPLFIEAEIEITLNEWYAQGVGGRMEDAVEGDVEIEVDSVSMEVTLFPHEKTNQSITFESTCMKTFDEYFEVEVDDAE